MSTVDLTAATFPDTVAGDGIVLVDWWASWCGPCQSFAPVYEEASEKHPDIVFGKVDTEAEQDLAGGFGIQSIPTLMLFREGILVFSQAGALPAAALEDIISQAKALDMDDIRAKVAAETEKTSEAEKSS
ncbi:MAG: thioredoxin [Aquihabitans sp.]